MSVEQVLFHDVRDLFPGYSWPAVKKGGAAAILTFLGFGIITDLIPNPMFARMVGRSPLDYAFLALTALLAGLYFAQTVDLRESPGDNGAIAGAMGGFLAFGCPLCNHILLMLFSSSAIMTYFDPLRPVLGVASVGLFGATILYRRRASCESCAE